MQEQIAEWWSWLQDNWNNLELIQNVLINALYALVILVVTLIVSGWVRRRIIKLSQRNKHFDQTLGNFLGNVARYAVIALGVIFVLNRFGIETTSLAALIGAAGLAIGLALQGTLSHLASGVMLIAFRPIQIGQFVEAAGHSGTVANISLFQTELNTLDNVRIFLPNGDVWSNPIKNFSYHDTRRCDLTFGVSYGTNLKKAEGILWDIINAEDRILKEPAEPFCKVTNLGDSSVDFTLRLWCNAGDLWDMKWDLTRQVKDAFDANDIDIPFPTRTIVMERDEDTEADRETRSAKSGSGSAGHDNDGDTEDAERMEA